MKGVLLIIGFLAAVLLFADRGIAAGKQDGKALYSAKCSGCHGADGKGNAALATALSADPGAMDLTKKDVKDVKKRSNQDLSCVIKNGKGKMPAVTGLSDAEITAVIKYVRSLK
ncbi:MAG: cytochrome c [Candidatus Sungbacteria bacterium]|nr:cytochrome c [Candidatus Sungbacteria bacterium]